MYKTQIKDEIIKTLNNFYQEERGNRVTTNVVDGLTLKLINLLEANKTEEKKVTKGKEEKQDGIEKLRS